MTVAFRPPTSEELAAIYGGAEHHVGIAGDRLLGFISFLRVEEKVWGLFGMRGPATTQETRVLFYGFRRILHAKTDVVHVTADDAKAERLLRLLGLQPTDQDVAGKRVWLWIPEHSTSSEPA